MPEPKIAFPLSLPVEVKESLEKLAETEGKSQNEIVVLALEKFFKDKKVSRKKD